MLERLENYPKAAHFVVGADYEQLRRGFFQTILGLLENVLGWEAGVDFTYRETPSPMLTLRHSGARLRGVSAEQAERIRSIEMQTIYCEEPPTWKAGNGESVYRVLVGRLRHSQRSSKLYPSLKPQGRMTFNPPSKSSWLYNIIENRWPIDAYPCWRFSLRENTLNVGVSDYIRDIETNYPEEQWASEIDGHWKDIGSGVYYTFSRSGNCKPVAELPPIAWDIRPDKPIWWSLDFNVEWQCSVMGQVHVQPMVTKGLRPVDRFTTVIQRIPGPAVDGWNRRVHYILKEFFLHDRGVPEVVEAFVEYYKQLTGAQYGKIPVWLYGDRSGASRSQAIASTNAARTNWAIIGLALRMANIPFVWRIPNDNPPVLDRINAVNLQMRSGKLLGGTRGVLIDEQECPNFIIDVEQVKWSQKVVNTIDKSDKSDEGRKRTHLSDAYGYFAYIDRAQANGQKIDFPDWLAR